MWEPTACPQPTADLSAAGWPGSVPSEPDGVKGHSEQSQLFPDAAKVDVGDSERILTVDRQRFRVRRQRRRGRHYYHCDWLTGPNAGYTFGNSGPFRQDDRDHRVQMRAFLAGINPATGYLRDN